MVGRGSWHGGCCDRESPAAGVPQSQSHLPLASTTCTLGAGWVAPAPSLLTPTPTPTPIYCHLPGIPSISSTPTPASASPICAQHHLSLRFSAHHAILTNHNSIIPFDKQPSTPTDQLTPDDTPPSNIRPTPTQE